MTDTSPLTWGYFFAAVGFGAAFVVLPLLVVVVNRLVERKLREHTRKALHRDVVDLNLERSVRAHPSNVRRIDAIPRQGVPR